MSWKWFMLCVLGFAGIVLAETPTPSHEVADPPEASKGGPKALTGVLTRQEAIMKALGEMKLSPSSLDLLSQYAEANPKANKERFAELVDFASKAAFQPLTDEQKTKLKKLYADELGEVKVAPGTEFASAAKLVRENLFPRTNVPDTAGQPQNTGTGVEQLSGKTVVPAVQPSALTPDFFSQFSNQLAQNQQSQLAATNALISRIAAQRSGESEGDGKSKKGESDSDDDGVSALKDAILANALHSRKGDDSRDRGRDRGRGAEKSEASSASSENNSTPAAQTNDKDSKLADIAKSLADSKNNKTPPPPPPPQNNGNNQNQNNNSDKKKEETPPASSSDSAKEAAAAKKAKREEESKKEAEAEQAAADELLKKATDTNKTPDVPGDLLGAAKGFGKGGAGGGAKKGGGTPLGLAPTNTGGGGNSFGANFGGGGGGGGFGGGGGGAAGGGGGGNFSGDVFGNLGNGGGFGGGGGGGQNFTFSKPVEFGASNAQGDSDGEGGAALALSEGDFDEPTKTRKNSSGVAFASQIVQPAPSVRPLGKGWVLDYQRYTVNTLCKTEEGQQTVGICQGIAERRSRGLWQKEMERRVSGETAKAAEAPRAVLPDAVATAPKKTAPDYVVRPQIFESASSRLRPTL